MMFLVALLLAFIAGVAMAVQGALNTGLGKIIGLLESTFVVHVIGTAVLVLLLFLLRLGRGELSRITDVPWYLYLGGVISVVILYTVQAGIAQLGAANATTAIIVGQVGTAVLLDCLGCFGLEKVPFTWFKVLGIALLAAGARLMLMK
jgi:transporter family-2 protein